MITSDVSSPPALAMPVPIYLPNPAQTYNCFWESQNMATSQLDSQRVSRVTADPIFNRASISSILNLPSSSKSAFSVPFNFQKDAVLQVNGQAYTLPPPVFTTVPPSFAQAALKSYTIPTNTTQGHTLPVDLSPTTDSEKPKNLKRKSDEISSEEAPIKRRKVIRRTCFHDYSTPIQLLSRDRLPHINPYFNSSSESASGDLKDNIKKLNDRIQTTKNAKKQSPLNRKIKWVDVKPRHDWYYI